jgi:flagellar biosynthesis GTPase FlhF
MSTATYQVKKKVTGGYAVSYSCPHCMTALTSKLEEAGTSQACPNCSQQFVVPGKAEREQLRVKQEQEKRDKERQRQLEEQAARKKAEAKRLAEEETERQNQIARREEAKLAQEQLRQDQRQLLITRRREVLRGMPSAGTSFSLIVVQILLAINAIVSLVGAVIAAFTIIGLPFAVPLLTNFVITMVISLFLDMHNRMNHGINELVAHARFQSSLLNERMSEHRDDE